MQVKRIPIGEFGANCYLAASGGELIVIDPGGEPERIAHEAEKLNSTLKFIILTHYHFDHVMGAEDVKKLLGGDILIHQEEKDFVNLKASGFLSEGDEIKVGEELLKVIHTPGHTKGSVCLLGNGVFFSGDTLFENGFGRTDFPGGSETELKKSLERIFKLLKPEMTVYPGHGEIFRRVL